MRVRRSTLRILPLGAALAVVTVVAGCSSPRHDVVLPEEQIPSEFAGAPPWVLQGCSAFWGDDGSTRICGVGTAHYGRSLWAARTKAMTRARTEISRSLETKIQNMVKDFQEQVSDGESEMNAEQFSDTTVALSRSTLNGTQIRETWISPSRELYILAALDVESFENSIREMDEMNDRLRRFIESRARRSFEELDEQMEDY